MSRRNMTYRIVPLESNEARDARLGSTVTERLEMVAELSRAAWIASGRPFPRYERRNIPFRWSRLSDQGTKTEESIAAPLPEASGVPQTDTVS